MAGTLIALALIFEVAATVFLIARWGRWPIAALPLVAGLCITVIVWSIIFPTVVTRGTGLSLQILLITISCIAVSAAVPLKPPKYGLYSLLSTLLLSIVIWLCTLGAMFGYTLYTRQQTYLRFSLQDRLENHRNDEQVYSAGWVADQPFAQGLKDASLHGSTTIPHREWHTWLTGLYRREYISGDAWYPGGKIRDAKIEIRLR